MFFILTPQASYSQSTMLPRSKHWWYLTALGFRLISSSVRFRNEATLSSLDFKAITLCIGGITIIMIRLCPRQSPSLIYWGSINDLSTKRKIRKSMIIWCYSTPWICSWLKRGWKMNDWCWLYIVQYKTLSVISSQLYLTIGFRIIRIN